LWYNLKLEKKLDNIENQVKNHKKQLSKLDENSNEEEYEIIEEKMIR
jgi:septation ring formation regulator EzrA